MELDRRLHGEHRHQLQGVALDDVAQRAGVVVELAAALDADRLGHGDLDRVDVATVPDRLEQAVAEAEDGQVLDRLLAEVVVDPVDLLLVEDLGQLAVQRARARQVGAERLLDDDAGPAALRAAAPAVAGSRQAGPVELVDDLRVERRRHREVEEPIARRAAVAVDPVEPLRELDVGGRIVEVTAVVLDALRERLPDRLLRRPVAAVLVDALEQVGAELVVGQVAPREADDGELRRQEAAEQPVVERGSELALGEVAGRSADDHRARLGHALEAQALAQRIRSRLMLVGRRPLASARAREARLGHPPARPRPRRALTSALRYPRSLIAWPPNSLRRAARTRSV